MKQGGSSGSFWIVVREDPCKKLESKWVRRQQFEDFGEKLSKQKEWAKPLGHDEDWFYGRATEAGETAEKDLQGKGSQI